MTVDRTPTGRAILTGIVAGIVTYVVGYLVVYVLFVQDVERRLRGVSAIAELFGGDPIPATTAIGWVFYNAHYVLTRIPRLESQNLIVQSDDPYLRLMFLVPPLLLIASGIILRLSSTTARDHIDAAIAGFMVVPGYLFCSVLGLAVFRYEVPVVSGTITPDPLTAILLAGILYPAVFGIAGALLASAFLNR